MQCKDISSFACGLVALSESIGAGVVTFALSSARLGIVARRLAEASGGTSHKSANMADGTCSICVMTLLLKARSP